MKLHSFITLGTLLGCTAIGHATVIGFGNLGGSNTDIPGALGSNAAADGNGFVVANGATPNIALAWAGPNWDIHTSTFFAPLEDRTVGGGAWDNEGGGPRIAQLDTGSHTIVFSASSGFALKLNSFDFALTTETAGITAWNLTLTNSLSSVVWSQAVTLDSNNAATAGITVAPNFTGTSGESYTLAFNRTSETFGSGGRHGIDNLSFNQVAIPEPGSAALFGIAGLALLSRRRK